MSYLFTSERLGFRNWHDTDLPKMTAVSGDPQVMRFFPKTYNQAETDEFIERMKKLFDEKGYCFFATERLVDKKFIGFIGLNYVDYESPFNPATEIGWRLGKDFWGNGYATEGAKRCLEYGFEELKLSKIIAIAPKVNSPSINVMKKIGMEKIGEFVHPKLLDYPRIMKCDCYKILL